MKKYLLTLSVCLLAVSGALAQNTALGFGVKAGVGLADQYITLDDNLNVSGIDKSELDKSETKFVVNAGVYVEGAIPSTNLAINVGASYRAKGTKKKLEDGLGNSAERDINLQYLSLDAVLKLYVVKLPLVGVYVGLGPRGDFKLSSSGDLFSDNSSGASSRQQAFNSATFSGVAVAGAVFSRISAEVEYNPDFTYSSKTDYGTYKVNTRNAVIGVNVAFRLL
ncbi:MAG: outer membrane beta-barrel protein [Bacteroidota bacterium]